MNIELDNQLTLLLEYKLRLLKRDYKPYISKSEPEAVVKDIKTLEYKISNISKNKKKKEEYE